MPHRQSSPIRTMKARWGDCARKNSAQRQCFAALTDHGIAWCKIKPLLRLHVA
jgi:hypothetical protein